MDSKNRVVSLFTGAGGMDIGFHKAGFHTIWANDIDPYAVETFNNYVGKSVASCGDLTRLSVPDSGSAELVIGGPPCQGFSVAGKMDPNDPRSQLVWDFLKVVDRVKPKAFVMENVKALAINKRFKDVRDGLIKKAQELGYETELHVLNSADFGVPQKRERMFLIGIRGGGKLSIEPTTAETPVSVRSILEQLPKVGTEENNALCKAVITPARYPVLRKSPYSGMLFNGQGRPINLSKPSQTLPASMGGNRTPIIDQLSLDNPNEISWVEEYHKGLMEGGPTAQVAPTRLRRLTVLEAQAIQTFPLDMKFSGSQSTQFRQIGNAVPCDLAYHVAKAVKKVIAN